jgi:hypothetical protein
LVPVVPGIVPLDEEPLEGVLPVVPGIVLLDEEPPLEGVLPEDVPLDIPPDELEPDDVLPVSWPVLEPGVVLELGLGAIPPVCPELWSMLEPDDDVPAPVDEPDELLVPIPPEVPELVPPVVPELMPPVELGELELPVELGELLDELPGVVDAPEDVLPVAPAPIEPVAPVCANAMPEQSVSVIAPKIFFITHLQK